MTEAAAASAWFVAAIVVLAALSCATEPEPATSPTTAPADPEFFLARLRDVKLGLVHIGSSDKPTLPLLVAVGDSIEQTGERETETINGVTRQVAIVCPLREDEMADVIRRTFDAGLLGGQFAWRREDGNEFARFLLTVRAGERKRSAEVNGAGAAAFRKILEQSVRPDNTPARRALRLD